MPDPKPGERDREAAYAWLTAGPDCPHGYRGRRSCPDCVGALIARTRLEGDAAGYARGLEDAAKEAEDGGYYCCCAQGIRSLAAAAVLREKPDGEER